MVVINRLQNNSCLFLTIVYHCYIPITIHILVLVLMRLISLTLSRPHIGRDVYRRQAVNAISGGGGGCKVIKVTTDFTTIENRAVKEEVENIIL